MNCERCTHPIPEARAKRRAKYCSEVCKKLSENDRHFAKHLKTKRTRNMKCQRCQGPIAENMQITAKYCSVKCRRFVNARRNGERREALKRATSAGIAYIRDRDWEALKRRYKYCCAYCGKHGLLQKDHVVPLSRGGDHRIGNILPACGKCNNEKGSKFLVEWGVRPRL